MKQAVWVLVWALGAGLTVWPAACATAATNTWDGNGSSDAGGNWSAAANWNPDGVPGAPDTAILPATTMQTRNVTVDVDTVVYRLTMQQSADTYGNNLRLGANLSVTNWSGPGWQYGNSRLYMNGRTLTIGSQPTFGNFLGISGNGTIIKTTSGTVNLGNDGASGFSGQWLIQEGSVGVYYSDAMTTASNVVVYSGATLKSHNSTVGSIPLALNGMGVANAGALAWEDASNDRTWSPAVTLASTSGIAVAGTATLTMTGVVGGPGGLVKLGTGTLRLTATALHVGETVVSNGTFLMDGNGSVVLSNSHVTVKSGATLIGPPFRYPQGVTVEPGGTWDQTLPSGWWGNGDPNNSGNWWDPANWGEGVVPSGAATATLVSVTGIGNSGTIYRTVTVDSNTTVWKLAVVQDNNSYGNCIKLNADLSVSNWSGAGYSYNKSTVNVNGRTLTIGSQPTFAGFMALTGSGTVIKTTSGTVNLGNMTMSMAGTWRIDQGTLGSSWYNLSAATNITVNSGGKLGVTSASGCTLSSGEMILSGNGGDGNGALDIGGTGAQAVPANPLTIRSNAVIRVGGGTTTCSGKLRGPGRLTKTGAGTLALTGSWVYVPSNGNGIVVSAGVLSIAGCTLALTNVDAEAYGEYALADYSGGGSVSGAFKATNGLPKKWFIDYDGTDGTPDAVVLVSPHPAGTVIMLK